MITSCRMNYLSYIHTFTVQIIGISQKSEYFVLRASNFSVCRLSSICCICEYCSMLIVCLCFLCERYFPALWLVDCVCVSCVRDIFLPSDWLKEGHSCGITLMFRDRSFITSYRHTQAHRHHTMIDLMAGFPDYERFFLVPSFLCVCLFVP